MPNDLCKSFALGSERRENAAESSSSHGCDTESVAAFVGWDCYAYQQAGPNRTIDELGDARLRGLERLAERRDGCRCPGVVSRLDETEVARSGGA